MTRTFERKIKRLEEKSLSIPSSTFDLVKIITEQREEIERLRKLSDIEFEAYLKEAEQTLIDATDEFFHSEESSPQVYTARENAKGRASNTL